MSSGYVINRETTIGRFFDEIMDTIYDHPKPELPVEDPGITSLINRNENGLAS